MTFYNNKKKEIYNLYVFKTQLPKQKILYSASLQKTAGFFFLTGLTSKLLKNVLILTVQNH